MTVHSFELFSLPYNVLYDVLCSRLGLKDLARLDSACCQQLTRATLMKIFRSKQFVLNSAVRLIYDMQFNWLCIKNMKTSALELDNMQCVPKLAKYLEENGSFLRRVCLGTDTTTSTMSLVAIHCNSITSLQVEECDLAESFREILLNNPNIADLRCQRVGCEEGLLSDMSLNKLKIYCIDETRFLPGFPWSATTFSSSLHTARWDCSDFSSEDLTHLVTNCPQLKTLSCDFVDLEPSFLGQISPKLSGLFNLSICGNNTITDNELLCALRNLTSLRVLGVTFCDALTDQSLYNVTQCAGDTLEMFYTDIKKPESADTQRVLEYFAQKCINLTHLDVHCGDAILCSGDGTSLLVNGCPKLSKLVVNKETTICASSRRFISAIRPSLAVELRPFDDDYDVLSFPVV